MVPEQRIGRWSEAVGREKHHPSERVHAGKGPAWTKRRAGEPASPRSPATPFVPSFPSHVGKRRLVGDADAHASDGDFLDVSGRLPRDAEKRDYGLPLWHPGSCEAKVSLLSDTLNACLASLLMVAFTRQTRPPIGLRGRS